MNLSIMVKNYKGKVCNMYQDEYKRWLAADLEDADLKPELARIEGNDDEIKDRFAVALKFGTAGLRGVLGAGTNRMNIYVVRQATQGLANWVKTQGGNQTVAISYDSRLKSDIFAKTAAGVLAANGIKVRIYDALMPVPALSFATRYYECNAGIMVTASHNPAKYNGYKAYGPDGCQMTDDAAAIVYDEIQKTDVLTGAKYISFAEGIEQGLIRFVGDDCKNALYAAIEARQVRPGLCKTAGLKLVYSPLNGSGLVPVTHVLNDMGITDITIVPEQEYPNGYFTTCSYPNPEIFEALKLGLDLATKTGADLMLATDPDADRVGIAMKCPDGSYELVSGNEMGALLLDYICAGRIEKGTMPKDPVAVKSIVSTPLADAIAAHYGVEMRSVLTGFKWIGDQIANLEAAGEVDRFIFGFEESYGYLAGPYVRDKDAVIGSMLICEMAAYYRSIGSSIKERLEEIYKEYGRYLNKVDSFEFPGLTGMEKMASIMQKLRDEPLTELAGHKVVKVTDYKKPEETGLPAANVLIYTLDNGLPRPDFVKQDFGIFHSVGDSHPDFRSAEVIGRLFYAVKTSDARNFGIVKLFTRKFFRCGSQCRLHNAARRAEYNARARVFADDVVVELLFGQSVPHNARPTNKSAEFARGNYRVYVGKSVGFKFFALSLVFLCGTRHH